MTTDTNVHQLPTSDAPAPLGRRHYGPYQANVVPSRVLQVRRRQRDQETVTASHEHSSDTPGLWSTLRLAGRLVERDLSSADHLPEATRARALEICRELQCLAQDIKRHS